MFGRGWEPSTATIVMRHEKGGGLGTGRPTYYEYLVDVQPLGGGPVFRTTIQQPNHHYSFKPPHEGEVIRVLINPKKNEVKFDEDDPARSRAEADRLRKEQEEQAWAAAQQTPVGSQPAGAPGSLEASRIKIQRTALFVEAIATAKESGDTAYVAQLQAAFKAGATALPERDDSLPPPAPAGGGDRIERLQKLAELHASGVLTDAEFAAEKARILSEA